MPPWPSEEERNAARSFLDGMMNELSRLEAQAVPSLEELAEACQLPSLKIDFLNPGDVDRYSRLFRCQKCNAVIFDGLKGQHEGLCRGTGGRINKRHAAHRRMSSLNNAISFKSESKLAYLEEEHPLKRSKLQNGNKGDGSGSASPPRAKLSKIITHNSSDIVFLGDSAPLSPVLAAAAIYRKGRSNIDRRRRERVAEGQANPENGNYPTGFKSSVSNLASSHEAAMKFISQNSQQWLNNVKVNPSTKEVGPYISAPQYASAPTYMPASVASRQQQQQPQPQQSRELHGQLPFLQVAQVPFDGQQGAGNLAMPPARLQRRGNQLVLLPSTQTRLDLNGRMVQPLTSPPHSEMMPHSNGVVANHSLGQDSWKLNGQYMIPNTNALNATATMVTLAPNQLPQPPQFMINMRDSGVGQANQIPPGYHQGRFHLPGTIVNLPNHQQQQSTQQSLVGQPVPHVPPSVPAPQPQWWAQ